MLMLAGVLGVFVAASLGDLMSIFEHHDDVDDGSRGHEDEATPEHTIDGTPLNGIDLVHHGQEETSDPTDTGVTIQGGGGADTLVGTPGDDILAGNDGDDQIGGYAGADTISGGPGNDDLHGDDGSDNLDGGSGDDSLAGGGGDDTLLGQEGDDLVTGQLGRDLISGGEGNDSLVGGSGDDSLDGGAGDDALQGGDGNDVLMGGIGADTLMGDGGDDLLMGVARTPNPTQLQVPDYLNGGAGNDTLVAGQGDWLDGGDGQDEFVLHDWLVEDDFTPTTIDDYRQGDDQIVVLYDPAVHPDPQLSLHPSDDGSGDMQVHLDGMLIARVLGSPSLALGDLSLLPVGAGQ